MIKFTQYLMPDGRKSDVTIDRPKEIEDLAHKLQENGYCFDVEMLGDFKTIAMYCRNRTNEEDVLSMKTCPNGPAVLDNIDEMIRESIAQMANAK